MSLLEWFKDDNVDKDSVEQCDQSYFELFFDDMRLLLCAHTFLPKLRNEADYDGPNPLVVYKAPVPRFLSQIIHISILLQSPRSI